jgi:hypothetical protein
MFFILLVFLLPHKLTAQFNGRYFSYSDSTMSKDDINTNIEEVLFYIDSLKRTYNFHYKTNYSVGLYSPENLNPSDQWSKNHKEFYKKLKRKVGAASVSIMESNQGPYDEKVNNIYIGVLPYFTEKQDSINEITH